MPNKKIRLDKAVSHNFGASRAEASYLIKNSLVEVDGEVITDPAFKISENSEISLDGNTVEADSGFKKRVFMLNKPEGYICADRDNRAPVVVNLFNEEMRYTDLHCVGRLDIDTQGLLLVTDDGELNHKITSPKTSINKVYIARTKEEISPADIEKFARGLKHPEEEKRYLPASLEILEPKLGRVTVTEGRFHEVKRLFECVGNEVVALRRVKIGGLELDDDLEVGEYRELSADEIALLFS